MGAWFRATLALGVVAGAMGPLTGQEPEEAEPRARLGSELRIPLASVVLPGLGQYLQGAKGAGIGYSAAAVTGLLLGRAGDPSLSTTPRDGRDQLAFEGRHLVVTAGALSAWDAFHRAVPALKREGKYGFLDEREDLNDLLTAPFDVRFLGRWTTWVDLALTGGVTWWVLGQRDEGTTYAPFRANDAAFVGSLSYNAAVGEEALFRGWLLPLLHQRLGDRFALANGIQAVGFGVAHVPQAREFALVIAASAAYSGWLTRHNGWSVREPIFQHFWYDVLVATAELLSDESAVISLPRVLIRF